MNFIPKMHWEVGVAQRRATYTVAEHTTFRADIGVAELIQEEGGANASELEPCSL